MSDWKFLIQTITVLALLLTTSALFAGKPAEAFPLGPTGLTGQVDKKRKTIQVANVAKGSPAADKIKANDVIIGVNGVNFKGDPRRDMAAAIDVSESREAGGKMTLSLKGGKQVVLKLRVLGSYSATAPYNCEKTDTIITEMAESLLKLKKGQRSETRSGILGLMATGEKKYIDAASKMIQFVGKDDPEKIEALLRGETDMGMVGWSWGYNCIALAEYYLLTKDKSVLPRLRTYALALARGQDGAGTWGHRMATPRQRHGRLPGYSHMNQPTLSCFIGIILAKRCGIDDPVLDTAIEKTNAYVSNIIGKGAFDYGVSSGTTRYYNNNGTSGSAALCMELLKNSKGAQFFSQMAATSYDDLEIGHASRFFNPLWTTLGAHVSGPNVTQQFFRKSLWYHNTRRRWDGGYGDDRRREGPEAGVALLAYCLPRKALLITGRDADKSNWLKPDAATKVIMLSQIDYEAMSDEELIALAMDPPFPRVKRIANWKLMMERKHLVPKIEGFIKTGTYKEKFMALGHYGMHRPLKEKAHLVNDFGAIIRDAKAPTDVRVAAAESLGYHFKELAYPYYMDIVKLLAQDRPDDPFGDIDCTLGRALNGICSTPFGSKLVSDKAVFYKAVNKLLSYKRDYVAAEGIAMLADMQLEDFHNVGDRILYFAKNDDPSMEKYHSLNAFTPSIELLARFKIKEGLDCLENGFKGGRYGNEVQAIASVLPMYGANAKSVVDVLEKQQPDIGKGNKTGKKWVDAAKAIRASNNPEKLISFEEAMKAGR